MVDSIARIALRRARILPGTQRFPKDNILFAGLSKDKEIPYISARRDGPLPTNQGERLRTLSYGDRLCGQ